MKRKFLTNLGFLVFLNLLIKTIYVFRIDVVVQNTVGAKIYGSYFSLFNTVVIFQILLDLGIENFIRREIAQHPTKVDFYLSNILIIKIFLAIPFLIICFLLAFFMGIHKSEVPLLLIILFNQFLASMILYLRANLGGLQLFKTESIISVLDRTVMILVVGYLLLNPSTHSSFKIIWFVLAQTFSYILVLIVCLYIIIRRIEHFRIKIRPREILPVLQKLRPFATLVLLMAIYYRGDSMMLRILLPDGEEQSGIYAHGFRILDYMSNYASLFPLLLLPMFSRSIVLKEKIGGLLELSVLLLTVPSITVIIPAVIYRNELFAMLFNEHIVISANVFAILIFSYLGMCISYTFGALLTANGNLRQLNLMALGAVIISLTLNIILVPKYKVIGSAIANASAQVFTIIIQLILAKRIFTLKVNYNTILRLVLFTGFTIGAGLLIRRTPLDWVLGSICIFLFGLSVAMLSGLISIRGMINIIREERITTLEEPEILSD